MEGDAASPLFYSFTFRFYIFLHSNESLLIIAANRFSTLGKKTKPFNLIGYARYKVILPWVHTVCLSPVFNLRAPNLDHSPFSVLSANGMRKVWRPEYLQECTDMPDCCGEGEEGR